MILDIVVGKNDFLICFSAQFMINYLQSSDVFSTLKSVRQFISLELEAINTKIKVSFYEETVWV